MESNSQIFAVKGVLIEGMGKGHIDRGHGKRCKEESKGKKSSFKANISG